MIKGSRNSKENVPHIGYSQRSVPPQCHGTGIHLPYIPDIPDIVPLPFIPDIVPLPFIPDIVPPSLSFSNFLSGISHPRHSRHC